MTRNQTVEINHLTVLQIQYLTELEQLEKGKRDNWCSCCKMWRKTSNSKPIL